MFPSYLVQIESFSYPLFIVHSSISSSSDPYSVTNLHISPVYFNTVCTRPPESHLVSSHLTVEVFLNPEVGGRAAGGSAQEGLWRELTFLGVRIAQEQQAHSSSGRCERSSLMMIAIIQAICANRRHVFICLLRSPRLAVQPALPPVLFDYHLCCFFPQTLAKDDHCFVPVMVSASSFHVLEEIRNIIDSDS